MDYDKIKEFHEQRPFKPFDIRTADGRVYSVEHPEFLMQSHNRLTVTFTTDDDRAVALDARQIVALEVANTPAA